MLLLALISAALASAAEPPALRVEAARIETPRHVYTLAATGLPAQIEIKAEKTELPLEMRRWVDPKRDIRDVLQSIGRGEQLRAPMRLVVKAGSQETVAEAAKPAQARAEGGTAVAESDLRAGDTALRLHVVYSAVGRMDVKVSSPALGPEIAELALVVDLLGPVDVVVAGPPVGEKPRVYAPAEFALAETEGVVWTNTGKHLAAGARAMPGPVERVFIGSGDRGMTWLAPHAGGFGLDPEVPSMTVERDRAGQFSWRCRLVNRAERLGAGVTISFSILVHPARARPASSLRQAWFNPPEQAPRADRAVDEQSDARLVFLEGPACGDALSAEQNLAVCYPIRLFRYLAGTHTGLTAQLRTNASALTRPSMAPGADRAALGRALLHDIGLDPNGMANLSEVATVVKALEAFGCFSDDGNTEFIPYWRAGTVVRYGEPFEAGDAFNLQTEDPNAGVYVSAWRRPAAGGHGCQVLLVVVNERSSPVRDVLYLLDNRRLFGGPNALTAGDVVSSWPMSTIPADSDWAQSRLAGQTRVRDRQGKLSPRVVLKDMTDSGFVWQQKTAGTVEIYGQLFVPAYGYRILWGTSR